MPAFLTEEICALAKRRSGSGHPEAGAERLHATLAGIEARQ